VSVKQEAVVRRFYEEMCNDRHNEIAPELFRDDYVMHDPQIPSVVGPKAMADLMAFYQTNVEGHWEINDIFSTDDRVVVRWTGSGTHVGEVNGIAPTGNKVEVDAISVFRLEGDKIAEMWEVWDTLSFLQQLGAVPSMN